MLHHFYDIENHFYHPGLFCFQHLIRDRLQDEGVRDWYTTFGHAWTKFIPNTRRNNHIGMVIFFLAGCLFTYLAIRL